MCVTLQTHCAVCVTVIVLEEQAHVAVSLHILWDISHREAPAEIFSFSVLIIGRDAAALPASWSNNDSVLLLHQAETSAAGLFARQPDVLQLWRGSRVKIDTHISAYWSLTHTLVSHNFLTTQSSEYVSLLTDRSSSRWNEGETAQVQERSRRDSAERLETVPLTAVWTLRSGAAFLPAHRDRLK